MSRNNFASNRETSTMTLGVEYNYRVYKEWVRRTGSARDKADNCGSAARDKADNYVYS
ncbi:hypothetical protein J6590_049302 [Homalodisca vitripennis]|nr:hypothetical protein J6590_049302 [Homalodisca vitripennis]